MSFFRSFINGFASTSGAILAIGLSALSFRYYLHYQKSIKEQQKSESPIIDMDDIETLQILNSHPRNNLDQLSGDIRRNFDLLYTTTSTPL